MEEKASMVPNWTIHRLKGAPIAIPAYIAIPFQVITLPEFCCPRSPIPQVSIPVTRKLSAIPCTIRDINNKERDNNGIETTVQAHIYKTPADKTSKMPRVVLIFEPRTSVVFPA
ncbi:hypothetical protein D3C72_935840 [compost metagenome]